jgi:hypothetical protein
LTGSDTATADYFGSSVAISGTTAVVGAPNHAANAGRAYVFTQTASGWKPAAELKGSDTVADDYLGSSVAIWGTVAVVGAPGHAAHAGRAYVFTKTASGWKQTAELKGSNTVAGDSFGVSVAIAGTTAVVGAWNHSRSGRSYVFTKTISGWKQTAELKGSDTGGRDGFGGLVAISGTTVVVGARDHANYAGRAYVFTKTASGWKQTKELKGSDTVAADEFGYSLGVSGTTVIVGTPLSSSRTGRAYVFTKTASGWKQTAELKGSDTAAGDALGTSVAISGTTVVVSAPDHASAGRSYLFTKTASGWKQTAELKGSDTVANDYFGSSVAFSGTTAVVGASDHAASAGRAYVFKG